MDNKEKLMNKIAVYAQAKEPAMQLLTKIAACSKSKGKKQAVRKMAMPKTASERIRALYKGLI